ncbi:WAP four-disulfide core domain protein 12 [Saimiri boliviensis]|uniref:WAP four-disulfide core domain protein 12 n=1 Tax=Saimiri boliviensis boliviensis TaxID=39432 RepID=WFD12_SAIBB|nr:RecName: Full=WAP four-disulfide core domain protein 12; Flags: Precursor [Saimiri boliviensis boliviensis]ABO53011.1 WAP four-disulfide core domain 12 precursor [Saimiri boliviensis boliviensis]
MRSSRFLVLMVSLALVTLVASEGVKGNTEKPGVCPADNVRCIKSDPPQCHTDQDCQGIRKCCYLHCGFKCVIPVKELEEGGSKDEDVSRPCPESGWEVKPPGFFSTRCPQK